jgi:thiol-disulfide isomerase/thioredoxin
MGKEYRCRLCGKAFPTRPALRAHIREEHSMLRYRLPEIFLAAVIVAALAIGLAIAYTPRPPAATFTASITAPASPEASNITLTVTPTTAMATTGEASTEAPRAPGFQLREYGSGRTVSLEDFQGMPVFLEFFSPSCPHCRGMMPVVEQLYEKYGDRAAFILVSYGEEGLKEVKESYNVRATMLVDPDGEVFAEYNIQYVPTFLILDRDHRIVWAHVGELDIGALESALERVLGG